MMADGDPGDAARDNYRRWREDIDLMTPVEPRSLPILGQPEPARGAALDSL